MLSGFVAHVFGQSFTDMLSGYRVFTRRFVKSFPALSGGFEIETELTVHALELELPIGEMPTPYYSRPRGSSLEAQHLARRLPHSAHRAAALSVRAPAGPVHRFRHFACQRSRSASPSRCSSPTGRRAWCRGFRPRSLATGVMVSAVLSVVCGLILDTVTRGRREMKLLAYLAQRGPAEERRRSWTMTPKSGNRFSEKVMV